MDSKKVGIGIGIIGLIVLLIIGILLFGGKKDVYEVTFENDGSSEVVEVKKNDTVARPADPTKSGYVFKGWYHGNTEFDFDSKITEDITLTAKWEKVDDSDEKEDDKDTKTYTVKFDSNGGSAVSIQNVKEGKTAIKPGNPTRTGYTFKGWYYNGTLYNFNTKVTANIVLTAKWEKAVSPSQPSQPDVKPEEVKSYTVKFDTDGGNSISSQTVEEGKLATKPSDPIKGGYTFAGWYDGNTEFDFETTITKDITLTAKWNKNDVITYKIEETDSYVGQVILFVLKNDVKVDGIVDITTTSGNLVKDVEISKDGYVTNGYKIESVSNVRAK